MIFEALDKIKRNAVLTVIIFAALGAIMLILPAKYVLTLILCLGYSLVICAFVFMLDFISSAKSLMDHFKFVGALITLIAGILVLVFRDNTMEVLAWLFGAVMVFDGLRTLIHSFTYARRSRRRAWWLLTVLSVFLIAGGVILFLNPWFGTPGSLMNVIGGAVLFSAVVSTLRLIWIWPVKKEKESE